MNTTDNSNILTSPSNHSHSPHSPIYTPSVPSPLTTSSINVPTSTSYKKSLLDIKPNPKNLFLVPNILASSASSVITSSGNSIGSHANISQHLHGYPHIAGMNNHLYHSNHIMSPNFAPSPNHSPNYYYDIPTTAIDGIKMENHLQHSYSRGDSYDEIERNNNKVLDLESKHAVSLGN
jgi:hypothetical protein